MMIPGILTAGGLSVSLFRPDLLNDRYVGWLNDRDVVRYSEQRHRVHTLKSCSDYWNSMQSSGNFFLAIELLEGSPCHIGNISVSIDSPNCSADLSIMIGDKSNWGKGYASTAWDAVMNYLLYQGGFRRVTAGTMEVNEPMIRLIKRSGMQIDSVRPRHFIWENQEIALVAASRFA